MLQGLKLYYDDQGQTFEEKYLKNVHKLKRYIQRSKGFKICKCIQGDEHTTDTSFGICWFARPSHG